MFRVNRFEPVNFIPVLERISSLAVHCNPSRMVENICRRWSYAKGMPLGQHGQGIVEPVATEERRDFEGLGYEWQPHDGECLHLKNRKLVIPQDLTNFVSAGVLDPNTSPASAQPVPCQSLPLLTEEWVCIEDYYSDEEQSDTIVPAQSNEKA